MAVKIGHASISEKGTITGNAGDQTGKEVYTRNYYVHSKGWRAFRPIDPNVALIMAECMKDACANNNIGYDQYQRNSLYTQAQKYGFDVSKVTVKCETDCSALIRVCCARAGIMDLPSTFRTGNMPSNLLKTGAFVELKGDKYTKKSDYLGAGDILVTKTSGHTVMVISNGPKYEGAPVEEKYELGDRILRNGSEGDDVKQLQTYLLDLDYDLGKWGADGDFGDSTEMAVRKFQKDNGLDVDGEYGPKSHAKLMEIVMARPDDEPVPAAREVVIEGGNCYVRSAPNTEGNKLGVAKRGEKYTYQGQTSENGWHLIIFEGQNGWVSGKYGKLI